MISKKVKLSNGSTIEIVPATWAQIHSTHLLSILNKYNGTDSNMIDEDDMDTVIGIAVPPKERAALTLNDAMTIFGAVIETSLGGNATTK